MTPPSPPPPPRPGRPPGEWPQGLQSTVLPWVSAGPAFPTALVSPSRLQTPVSPDTPPRGVPERSQVHRIPLIRLGISSSSLRSTSGTFCIQRASLSSTAPSQTQPSQARPYLYPRRGIRLLGTLAFSPTISLFSSREERQSPLLKKADRSVASGKQGCHHSGNDREDIKWKGVTWPQAAKRMWKGPVRKRSENKETAPAQPPPRTCH